MKKILSAILIALLVLTGCSNKYEKEEIKWFRISYYSSIEKADEDANILYVFFEKDDIYIEHLNYSEDIEHQYIINDLDTLKDYINTIKSQPDNYNRGDHKDEMQIILWSIFYETEDNEYSFAGADDYPDYWEEMWQVLLDVSEAESLEDFGFKNTNEKEEQAYE